MLTQETVIDYNTKSKHGLPGIRPTANFVLMCLKASSMRNCYSQNVESLDTLNIVGVEGDRVIGLDLSHLMTFLWTKAGLN